MKSKIVLLEIADCLAMRAGYVAKKTNIGAGTQGWFSKLNCMRYLLVLSCHGIFSAGMTQAVPPKSDTLLKKMDVELILQNGLPLSLFWVSGDICLTNDAFIFIPKVYRGGKYMKYNHLFKTIYLPYDSIAAAKKSTFLGGLLIKSQNKKYRIAMARTLSRKNKKLKETIAMINGKIKRTK